MSTVEQLVTISPEDLTNKKFKVIFQHEVGLDYGYFFFFIFLTTKFIIRRELPYIIKKFIKIYLKF